MKHLACMLAAFLASPCVAQDLPLAPLENFGKIVVTSKQSAGGGVAFEQAFGGQFDAEPASDYPEASVMRQLGRAVGRLDVAFSQGVGYCTAFLIADGHVMTNAHCLEGGQVQSINLVLGYVESGIDEGARSYSVGTTPLEFSPSDKLDFAILRVFGNPAAEWGTLKLAAFDVDTTRDAGMPLMILGHPVFQTTPVPVPQALYVSRKECRATSTSPLAGDRLRHTCDTLQGNSGSPVFSDDSREVIALHHAGSPREGINFAVPMTLIAEQSEIVSDLLALPSASDAKDEALEAALQRLADERAGLEAERARLAALQKEQLEAQARSKAAMIAYGDARDIDDLEERIRQLEAVQRNFAGTTGAALAESSVQDAQSVLRQRQLAAKDVPSKALSDAAMAVYLEAMKVSDLVERVRLLGIVQQDYVGTDAATLADAAVDDVQRLQAEAVVVAEVQVEKTTQAPVDPKVSAFQRQLNLLAQGPEADLTGIPSFRLPIIENPGPQKDIRAQLVTSKERSPVDTVYDYLNVHVQTLPERSETVEGTDLEYYEMANGGAVVMRGWAKDGVLHMLVLRMSGDENQTHLAHLTVPQGPRGFSSGDDGGGYAVPDDNYVAVLPDGDVLVSFDTLRRCSGTRRTGVMVRLSAGLDELVWTSPMRSSGGRTFSYNANSVFVIDGGSCEPDYLYELDIATGEVKTRQKVPSAQDSGDFTALDGRDLYLVLYNRFIHYRLPN